MDDVERWRAALVDRVEAEHPGLSWVADQLLGLKATYLDGDPRRWRPRDVDALLLEVAPRQVSLDPADHADYLEGAVVLLRRLALEGLLDGDVAALERRVRGLRAEFSAAMADRARWGLAKSLLGGTGDVAGIEERIAEFNALPYAERAARSGPPHVPPFPAVVLAPTGELERAAAASPWPERVRAFAAWAGAGRKLTQTGQLRLADARALVEALGTGDELDPVHGTRVFRTRSAAELAGLSLVRALAQAGGHVKVRKGVLSATRRALPAGLAGWRALLDVLLDDVGPCRHHWRGDDAYRFGWYADDLDAELVPMMLLLYREQEPVPVDELADRLWELLGDAYVWRDAAQEGFHRDSVSFSLRRALRLLAEFGVVELTLDEPEDAVALTPLGTWALHPVAASLAPAPVVGALADLPAADLLARAADLPEDEARGEADHWLARHGAPALVEALPGASETGRALAFAALLALGDGAAAAVEPLRTHPELGAWALVLRTDVLAADAAELVQQTPEQWVRVLAAALELHGPQAVTVWAGLAAGPGGPEPLLQLAWRVRLPQTVAVLEALGRLSGDKAVAKAARKAAFKARSAG